MPNSIQYPELCTKSIALSSNSSNKIFAGDKDFLSQFYSFDDNADWQLTLTENNLYCLSQKSSTLSLTLDFQQGNYRHRQYNTGKEPLLKAIKIKQKLPQTIIDATPGVLKDSFMLAGHGIKIIAIERNPLIYIMVKQSLSNIDCNIDYRFGDSKNMLDNFQADIIYLDPMYPAKKKSAQVKKEMQILHYIVGADSDSDMLFHNARKQQARIVVKRPNYAEPLANIQPNFTSSTGKRGATRFDIYLP